MPLAAAFCTSAMQAKMAPEGDPVVLGKGTARGVETGGKGTPEETELLGIRGTGIINIGEFYYRNITNI